MTDHSFQQQVIADLSEVKADIKSLIGNGQPGRVGRLEDKVSSHDKIINRLIGGLLVINSLLGFGYLFLKSRL